MLEDIKKIPLPGKTNNKTLRGAWLSWMNFQAHLKELCETKHCVDVLTQTRKIRNAIARAQFRLRTLANQLLRCWADGYPQKMHKSPQSIFSRALLSRHNLPVSRLKPLFTAFPF